MKNQIQLILKDNIRDVEGEKIAGGAKSFLNIDTGKIKTGKIFNVTYDLSKEDIRKFADLGLKDEIINDVYINSFYENTFYKSFVLVAKLPGVTDDEGVSAQKTLNDILDLDLDTTTQHIFTYDIYLIENPLSGETLKILAERLLGNKLIHHFEFGEFTGNIEYIPEVRIDSQNEIEFINLNVSDDELMRISKNRLLSLNLEEMKAIQSYFLDNKVIENREKNHLSENPTDCELEVLAQTW
ncbi:MAG: phosphoribosylformylglycinamidine synthase, partial [Candidatus Cloacimonetes bacterium]|nr:phosphoribosylformylglycinamidine synthase [Candidatus Cloacimonadota bacterium]